MNIDFPRVEIRVEIAYVRIIQGKIIQTTKIIKRHLKKTKKLKMMSDLWVKTKGIKENKQ